MSDTLDEELQELLSKRTPSSASSKLFKAPLARGFCSGNTSADEKKPTTALRNTHPREHSYLDIGNLY